MPSNFEEAVDYFAIFGGLDAQINTSKPIDELIAEHILDDYSYLRNVVNDLTTGDKYHNAILTGIASGDRRTNSSFRRAKSSFVNGMECVEELCDIGIIELESSLKHLCNKPANYDVSQKLLFNSPFMRFWFAFVSPYYKGIRDGNYEEFYEKYHNKKSEFTDIIFEQLSHECLKEMFEDDKFIELGRYWDNDIDINILGKTHSGKIIAGSCKYTNSKIKKNELSRLKEACNKVDIKADIFVLFSKKGYSSELKSLKSDTLKLFTVRNLNNLV